ncbi:MAG: DUF3048 domain-containing protein [Acidimicrobiia bacterium]
MNARDLLRDPRALAGAAVLLAVVIGAALFARSGEPVAAPETSTTVSATTSSPTSTSAPTSTSTTAAAPASFPLNGEAADQESILRRVLVAKIDNSPSGRPQVGLAEADLVIDVLVEGGTSRLLAFYHSEDPQQLGPVRSVREVDPKLVAPFIPISAHSGGVPEVEAALREVAFDLGHPVVPSAYRRDPNRPAPYDLIADPAALRAAGPPPAEEPLATTLEFDDQPLDGETAVTVEIRMSPDHQVTYRYSEVDGGYLRFHGDRPHEDASGRHLAATNVVVLFVQELETSRTDVSGAPVPDYEVLGSGAAVVFRNGQALAGTWERGRLQDFFRLVGPGGQAIRLDPGTTWIQLAPPEATLSSVGATGAGPTRAHGSVH